MLNYVFQSLYYVLRVYNYVCVFISRVNVIYFYHTANCFPCVYLYLYIVHLAIKYLSIIVIEYDLNGPVPGLGKKNSRSNELKIDRSLNHVTSLGS